MSTNTVRMLDIAEVKPYWRNPRDNRAAVAKVVTSIKEYGYNQLIAVDSQYVIIAGHTRYLALKELGWQKVSVLVLNDLDPEKAKAYRIIDNKTHEFSEWNPEDLALEMRELADRTVMGEFFSESDLTRMLEDAAGVNYKDVTEEDVIATEARMG